MSANLAHLHPAFMANLNWRRFKDSMRYQGSHFLRLRKPSKTLESSRPYVAGDAVHLIDWKVFARSDQLIIREHRDQAAAKVLIAVDVDRSMLWPDEMIKQQLNEPIITKAELALRICLNLAFIHFRLGDVIELWLHCEKEKQLTKRFRPTSSGQILNLFDRLEKHHFAPEILPIEFQSSEFIRKPYDVIYWISDGLSNFHWQPLFELATHCYLLHTMSSLEIDPHWIKASLCYFDESIAVKEYQGQFLLDHDQYIRQLQGWLQEMQSAVKGHRYLFLTEQTPVVQFQKQLCAVNMGLIKTQAEESVL